MAEMIVTAPVSDIMTKDVITAQENSTLNAIVDIFKRNNIRHLPIIAGEKVVGIVSRTDINRLSFGAIFNEEESTDDAILEMLSVPQVMSSKPKTVEVSTPIRDVAEVFTSSDYHALPVVAENKIVGIVTTTDVIKYMLKNC